MKLFSIKLITQRFARNVYFPTLKVRRGLGKSVGSSPVPDRLSQLLALFLSGAWCVAIVGFVSDSCFTMFYFYLDFA